MMKVATMPTHIAPSVDKNGIEALPGSGVQEKSWNAFVNAGEPLRLLSWSPITCIPRKRRPKPMTVMPQEDRARRFC